MSLCPFDNQACWRTTLTDKLRELCSQCGRYIRQEDNPPPQVRKHMVDSLVRIAKRHGYEMKRYVSPTFRIMENQAGEQLEIELLKG